MDKLQVGLQILQILNSHGYEAYIVGGAVRDYIRQMKISDVDITTSATPSIIQEIFDDILLEGTDYLSCRICLHGFVFEVTTYRKDIAYIDHRHPRVEKAMDLEEDLYRRDFTMNALLMNKDKEILDYFEGISDIHQGIIRMIGDPKIRFNEDALRVLRAILFASRFNYKLDDAILVSFDEDYVGYLKEEYIVDFMSQLKNLPFEIGLEYVKSYQLLRSFPFYQVVCEEAVTYHYYENIYALFYAKHHFLPVNALISNKDRMLAKEIAYFVLQDFNNLSLYYGNLDYIDEAIRLYKILKNKEITKEEISLRIKNLPIHTAKDILMDWDLIPSTLRGRITKTLEEAILLGKIKNEKKSILSFLEIGE